MTSEASGAAVARAGSTVLLTLCAAQFLMALDSSVMNVSIATVANDLDTTVTGIQSAIVLYTLVMAMLMVTGGKIGSMIGRKRAFMIGLVIYCTGSLTTALAPNLAVLLIGWSLLEGIGAALIMPAIVALVAGNFPPEGRPRAYGLVGAAGAIADRRRAAHRRARDHVRVVAVGVRRRGGDRGGDLPVLPADRGRAGREARPPRRAGLGALGARHGAGDLRGAAVLRVGVGPPGRGRAVGARPVAGVLADPRGARVAPAVHGPHPPPGCGGERAAGQPSLFATVR